MITLFTSQDMLMSWKMNLLVVLHEVQVDVFTEGNLSTLYGHLWFGSGQGTAYNNYSNKKHNT